jgi:hypothetical protein
LLVVPTDMAHEFGLRSGTEVRRRAIRPDDADGSPDRTAIDAAGAEQGGHGTGRIDHAGSAAFQAVLQWQATAARTERIERFSPADHFQPPPGNGP